MDKRKTLIAIFGLVCWGLLVAWNKVEYEVGGWFNDPTIGFGLVCVVIYMMGDRWYIYGKAVSQRMITILDSFSIRTTEKLIKIKGKRDISGTIYHDVVLIPRWSCRIPGVDIAPPGGRKRGYVMIPEHLFVKFGKDAIANVSDLQKYVGMPGDDPDSLSYYDLPKIYRVGLYNALKGKRFGYSFDDPIWYGEEQAIVIDEMEYDVCNHKEREQQLNNTVARLENDIHKMQEKESYNSKLESMLRKPRRMLSSISENADDGADYDGN